MDIVAEFDREHCDINPFHGTDVCLSVLINEEPLAVGWVQIRTGPANSNGQFGFNTHLTTLRQLIGKAAVRTFPIRIASGLRLHVVSSQSMTAALVVD